MRFRTHLAHFLQVSARYLAEPQQLALRRPFFLPEMFHALAQPWVQALNLATVFDVGANVGDFAYSVRPVLPLAQIYSFEPLPESFAAMLAHMRGAPKFAAYNLALGDRAGQLTFHRDTYAQASSFLPMAALHRQAFPQSGDGDGITVKVERLDDIVRELEIVRPLLVKLDVQGYEGHVLRGGEQTIRRARLLIVETSFEPLYEGQPLFSSIFQTLAQWGFAYLGPVHQLQHPATGRPLQEDSLFLAESPSR